MNSENLASLASHPPKGLILMDDQLDSDTMGYLLSKVKHIVGIDTGQPMIDNVCYDRYEAGCRAMRYLVESGHRKIAYIGAHISSNATNIGRHEAYLRIMKRYNFEIDPAWILDSEWHRGICFDKTDHMAIAAMSALHSLKISIPDEISIIGISDIEDSKYLNPPLTTISIPQKEIGEISASTLLQRISGDSSLPKRIIVPTRLVERESVKKI